MCLLTDIRKSIVHIDIQMWNLPNNNRQFGCRHSVAFPPQWLAAVQRLSSSLSLSVCLWSMHETASMITPSPYLASYHADRLTDRLSVLPHSGCQIKQTDIAEIAAATTSGRLQSSRLVTVCPCAVDGTTQQVQSLTLAVSPVSQFGALHALTHFTSVVSCHRANCVFIRWYIVQCDSDEIQYMNFDRILIFDIWFCKKIRY